MTRKTFQTVSVDLLTGTDICLLCEFTIKFPTEVECLGRYVLIRVPEDISLKGVTKQMQSYGYSAAFVEVISNACKLKYEWINLDFSLSSLAEISIFDGQREDAISDIDCNQLDSTSKALEVLKFYNDITMNYSAINDSLFLDLIMDILEYSDYRGWSTIDLYREALTYYLDCRATPADTLPLLPQLNKRPCP